MQMNIDKNKSTPIRLLDVTTEIFVWHGNRCHKIFVQMVLIGILYCICFLHEMILLDYSWTEVLFVTTDFDWGCKATTKSFYFCDIKVWPCLMIIIHSYNELNKAFGIQSIATVVSITMVTTCNNYEILLHLSAVLGHCHCHVGIIFEWFHRYRIFVCCEYN